MRKGYYLFRECGSLSRVLTVLGIISFVASFLCLFIGVHSIWQTWSLGMFMQTWHLGLLDKDSYFHSHHAWFLFFLALSIVLITANVCVHKICTDIATLLKEIENKK